MITPGEIAHAIGAPLPTDEQEQVIAAPLGSAVVLAGAGSGKTETIAARVVWLIVNGLVTPDQILGLTFTRSAARGLLTRIRLRLSACASSPLLARIDPQGALSELLRDSEPRVSTYDSYAGDLVSRWGLLLGASTHSAEPEVSSRVLLSESGIWQLAYHTLYRWEKQLTMNRKADQAATVVYELLQRMAQQLAEPEHITHAAAELERLVTTLPKGARQSEKPSNELQKWVEIQKERSELLEVVLEVKKNLAAAGASDFASQTAQAARLANECAPVREVESSTYRVVLLDEYQDTGYAQRVLLRDLFGRHSAVTAVGDPHQAIYGWRGASAGNLSCFAEDFGSTQRYTLLTSWRNPATVLRLANLTVENLRTSAGKDTAVPELRSRPDAPQGDVRLALWESIDRERAWIARQCREVKETALSEGRPAPTMAVLLRRKSGALGIAEALAKEGLESQVIGQGGLLDTPEITDLLAMVELVENPGAAFSALHVVTSARWRLGASDIHALSQRAAEMNRQRGRSELPTNVRELTDQLESVLADDGSDEARLGDAILDPGEENCYSPEGYQRVKRLGAEIRFLQSQRDRPLPDFVTLVERIMGFAVEADDLAKERLSDFAMVVAEHAKAFSVMGGTASVSSLVDYVRIAESEERGLSVRETVPDPSKVQVMTVHGAKGLEWDFVAVPHVVDKVFPNDRSVGTWVTRVEHIPPQDLGPLVTSEDRKELQEYLVSEKSAAKEMAAEEERRLGYVAVTRAKKILLLSGYWEEESHSALKGPSSFLWEWRDAVDRGGGVVDYWAQAPTSDSNTEDHVESPNKVWPHDPLAQRRPRIENAARAVRKSMAALSASKSTAAGGNNSTDASSHVDARRGRDRRIAGEKESLGTEEQEDVFFAAQALIAHREKVSDSAQEDFPELTVSEIVNIAVNTEEYQKEKKRRGPRPPAPRADRGTHFHEWVRRWYLSDNLIDLDELPGAADEEWSDTSDEWQEKLRHAFQESVWALRSPVAVEVPFELNLDGVLVRGRIDAVFEETSGNFVVVDWKTSHADIRRARVQLSLYRLAWQRLTGSRHVAGAVHAVHTNTTTYVENLLEGNDLAAIYRPAQFSERHR